MARKFVFAWMIVTILAACSSGSTIAAEQIITQEKDTTQKQTKSAAPENRAKKNIFGENSQKTKNQESWAARDLRKKGYDPQNMTGKDFRKMLGAE